MRLLEVRTRRIPTLTGSGEPVGTTQQHPVLIVALVVALLYAALWCRADPAQGSSGTTPDSVPAGSPAGRPTAVPDIQLSPQPAPTPMTGQLPAVDQPLLVNPTADGWPVMWSDAFDDNVSGWDVGSVNLDVGTVRRAIAHGAYSLEIETRKPLLTWSEFAPIQFTDLYAAIDFYQTNESTSNAAFGLILRTGDLDTVYVFLAASSGGIRLQRGLNDAAETLVERVAVDVIRPDEWNRLAVQATGPQLTFYINDQQIAEYPTAIVGEHHIGVAVQTNAPGHCTAQFDNFEARAAPGSPLVTRASRQDMLNTVTPTPKPTAQITWGRIETASPDTVPPTWPIRFIDTFVDNGNQWVTEAVFDRLMESSKVIEGTFAWQFKALQTTDMVAEVPCPAVSDFYAAVDVRPYDAPQDVWYGLAFRRMDRERFYTFQVNGRQTYQVTARAAGKQYQLAGPTQSEAIRSGEANHLGILVEGQKFTVFINGQPIVELDITADDIRFDEGVVGLSMSAEAGDAGIVEFDNFELRVPPE